MLEPRVDFGSGLKGANITHYRWSYRPLGSVDENDWLVMDEKGAPVGTPVFEPGFYRRLCSNSPSICPRARQSLNQVTGGLLYPLTFC